MSWIRLDDRFFSHRKVLLLTPGAKLLYIAAVAHCNANLLDGVITKRDLQIICATIGIKIASPRELIDAGMFEKTGGDNTWKIHDYHDYNDTSDDVKRKRESAKTRMNERRNGAMDHSEAPSTTANVRANNLRTTSEQPANNPRSSGEVREPTPTPTPTPREKEQQQPPDPPALAVSQIAPDGAAAAAVLPICDRAEPEKAAGAEPDVGDCQNLHAKLREIGVSERVTASLLRQHAADAICQQLGWLPRRGATNQVRVLVSSIKEGWDEPPGADSDEDAAAQAAHSEALRQFSEQSRRDNEKMARERAEQHKQDINAAFVRLPPERQAEIWDEARAIVMSNPVLGRAWRKNPLAAGPLAAYNAEIRRLTEAGLGAEQPANSPEETVADSRQ